jgi:hypothetical protein
MTKKLLPLIFVLSLLSCVQQESVKSVSQSDQTSGATCDVNSVNENLKNPESIEELTSLINALPKPLTADCLVKALKRPLYVNASSSTMSAQPASSWESPRIFIFKGNLIISVVPSGEGSKVLEFSEMISSIRSIKGEVVLPIVNDLTQTDAFSRINYGTRSSCSGCHTSERIESTINGVPVYSSLAFRPSTSDDVSLEYLKDSQYLCQVQMNTSQRCVFMNSLFSNGEVIAKPFPETMTLPENTFGL